MSKGTPRYTFRLPEDLMQAVELQILSRNACSPREEWDTSEFVRVALREKLAKMKRSRVKGRKLQVRAELLDDQVQLDG